MVALHVFVVVAAVGLIVRHALAGVLDDARTLSDLSAGKGAAPLNGRAPDLEVWIV
jgi:hypothetical protein